MGGLSFERSLSNKKMCFYTLLEEAYLAREHFAAAGLKQDGWYHISQFQRTIKSLCVFRLSSNVERQSSIDT
jgi:hypothetical protein